MASCAFQNALDVIHFLHNLDHSSIPGWLRWILCEIGIAENCGELPIGATQGGIGYQNRE